MFIIFFRGPHLNVIPPQLDHEVNGIDQLDIVYSDLQRLLDQYERIAEWQQVFDLEVEFCSAPDAPAAPNFLRVTSGLYNTIGAIRLKHALTSRSLFSHDEYNQVDLVPFLDQP